MYARPLVLGLLSFFFHDLALLLAVREDEEKQREEDAANGEKVGPAPRSTGCFSSRLLPARAAV